MLIVGQIINGPSVGIESAQMPVYVSELSPPSKCGRFVRLATGRYLGHPDHGSININRGVIGAAG